MTNNIETRIIIFSVILGVMFAIALYTALKHWPGKNKRIIYDKHNSPVS